MSKKRKEKSDALLIAAVLIIALLFVVVALAYGGYFSTVSITNIFNQASVPTDVTQSSQYHVELNINPSRICVGDSTTGTVSSNIPFGKCSIYVNTNGQGFKLFANIQLDASGYYSQNSGPINSAGTAVFQAFCCDAQWKCAISNQATLTVTACGGGGGGSQDGGGQIACTAVWNPTESTCAQAICSTGTCVYIPATTYAPARCECQTGGAGQTCNVGTVDCMARCRSQYGIDAYASQCGAGSCPSGWYQIIGEASCSSQGSCDRCCCQPQPL